MCGSVRGCAGRVRDGVGSGSGSGTGWVGPVRVGTSWRGGAGWGGAGRGGAGRGVVGRVRAGRGGAEWCGAERGRAGRGGATWGGAERGRVGRLGAGRGAEVQKCRRAGHGVGSMLRAAYPADAGVGIMRGGSMGSMSCLSLVYCGCRGRSCKGGAICRPARGGKSECLDMCGVASRRGGGSGWGGWVDGGGGLSCVHRVECRGRRQTAGAEGWGFESLRIHRAGRSNAQG
jgi:hypothetical protein